MLLKNGDGQDAGEEATAHIVHMWVRLRVSLSIPTTLAITLTSWCRRGTCAASPLLDIGQGVPWQWRGQLHGQCTEMPV